MPRLPVVQQIWACPSCEARVVLYVPATYVGCTSKHLKVQAMKLVEGEAVASPSPRPVSAPLKPKPQDDVRKPQPTAKRRVVRRTRPGGR